MITQAGPTGGPPPQNQAGGVDWGDISALLKLERDAPPTKASASRFLAAAEGGPPPRHNDLKMFRTGKDSAKRC